MILFCSGLITEELGANITRFYKKKAKVNFFLLFFCFCSEMDFKALQR
jgi:hypothetical protein